MLRLGIDLGGTNIVAGVVDEEFNILSKAKRKTAMPRSAQLIADDMVAAAKEAVERAGKNLSDITSVGVGTPGAVNSENGVVAYSCNLGFDNTDLAALIKERINLPVYIENDANAAAYGEYVAGAGKGTKDFVAVTIGTGVGGGIILNGKIHSGINGAGGEIGHMVIQNGGEICSCGRNGCFEAYASATALARQTKQAMIRYPESKMWEICGNNINAVDGLTAFDGMRTGDSAAKGVVAAYMNYLAIGIANIINIFQPEVICIGGGISHEKETLTNPIKDIVSGENYARNMSVKTEIKTALLGNDAGIIGAAFLDKLH